MAHALEPALEQIQVFLADRVVSGMVAPEGERLTDILANHLGLRVLGDDGTWMGILIHDIVAVAPPPHRSARRVHRARHRIELTAGPYHVTGTAHLPPGTQLNPFVLRTGRPVLPVTNAWIRTVDDAVNQEIDVALVVVKAVDELHGLFAPL